MAELGMSERTRPPVPGLCPVLGTRAAAMLGLLPGQRATALLGELSGWRDQAGLDPVVSRRWWAPASFNIGVPIAVNAPGAVQLLVQAIDRPHGRQTRAHGGGLGTGSDTGLIGCNRAVRRRSRGGGRSADARHGCRQGDTRLLGTLVPAVLTAPGTCWPW